MDDSARFDRLHSLFHDALDRPEHERRAFLEAACGDDEALLTEVLDMLAESGRSDLLLDTDIGEVAYEVLFGALPEIASGMVDRYRLEKEIGHGGMGVVWRALDTELQRHVALKLSVGATLSPGRREQFDREQRNLAKLNHSFIAHLYDAKVLDDGTPWFAMEHIDGVYITEACKGRPIEQTLKLFCDVCEAVHYAHGEMVIHCDLKPSNILVTKDGTVKLLDFGISKQLLDSPLTPATTKSGAMTLDYAAPEQIRGEASVRTDVYSLGVILYELLAGAPPFNLSNLPLDEMERVIAEREPDRPSLAAGRNGVAASPRGGARGWADLDAICLTAMHKDKKRRYETVRALIDDIDRYQRTEPLEARRKTIGYRTRKFVDRNWRALATTAAVAATMIVMTGLFIINLERARDEALAAAARALRIQKFTSDLFKGGDPEMPPADLRVTTLVENGIRDAEGLDNEPEVQAELYHTLGTITQNMGDFARADTLVTRALDQRRLFGRERPQVAESLIALGLIRMDQVRLPHAEELVRKGLEIRRRQRPLDTEAVADALTSLGRVLDQRGEHKEAIKALDEAVALQSASSGPVSQQLADTLTALANANHQAGDFKRADELNLRVLAIDRERFGEKHIYVANDLINLGASLHERGHDREAEQYYRQALPITEGWYKSGHVEIASNLRGLAGTLVPQERLDEAWTLLERALEMDERMLPADHPRIALSVHAMGNFSYRRGDYDDAEARYRRALDMFRRKYGEDHNRTTTAKSTLATVAIKRGNFTEADTLLRDVIQRLERTTPGHVNIGINRMKLGRSLVTQRRYREAIVESLAGYENLVKQMNPSSPYVQDALRDLVTAYEALNEPERAAHFRRELEKTGAAPAVKRAP